MSADIQTERVSLLTTSTTRRGAPAAVVLAALLIARTFSDTAAIGGGAVSALNLIITLGAIVMGFVFSLTPSGRGGRGFVPVLLVFTLVGCIFAVGTFGVQYAIVGELLRFTSILGMAVIARSAVQELGFERLSALVLASGLPAVFILVVALVTKSPLIYGAGTSRAFGTFNQTNGAAAFVALYACLALYMLLRTKRPRYLIPLLVAMVAAVSTLSLGGLSALLVGALVLLLGSAASRGVKLFALLLIAAGAVVAYASGILSARLAELETTVSIDQVAAGQTTNSLDWRFYNWKRLMDIWAEQPLQGWGLGSTNAAIQPIGKQPHSEYVRAFVETGLIGVSILVCVLLVFLVMTFAKSSELSRWGKTIVVTTLAVVLTNAIASNTISYVPAMYLAVIMFAIGFGDRRPALAGDASITSERGAIPLARTP
ncbi:O-antigen ligase family protein [Herbiconiux liukaitaii]|uniref:O-antigen ligase family protein n=1 Tax=Herbiconiux liukaitaii TaxID=3342799 RepID=UPI0035B76B01